MTNPAPRDDSNAEQDDQSDEKTPFSIRDRWWWSGTFRTVIGFIIAYLQWGPISEGNSNWMNWAMIAVGAAVAIWGIIDLIRDYGKHSQEG